MDKKTLRKKLKATLENIDNDKRREVTHKLLTQLIHSDLWNQAQTVGVTVSGGFEWDTISIIEQGWKDGKTIVVPKCIPEIRQLDFYQIDNFEQLEDSFYNLREPNPLITTKVEKQDIDLLIVPGIGFDKRGFRIGFGGGYYDRFLANFPNKTVSICYSKQLIDKFPNEPYDMPVQTILTENGFVDK